MTPSDAFRIMMTRIVGGKALPFHPLTPKNLESIRKARRGGLKLVDTVGESAAAIELDDEED